MNISLAISHKRSAAKHCHKERTLRAASWALSFGEGDGYVWFNFIWVSRKNISLLPLVTPCILPDIPFLSILPGDLCKSVLSSPSTWPFGVSCYFPCLWLLFTRLHVWRLRAKLSAGWEWAQFHWLQWSCSNLQAAGGLEMGKNKHPTSRHPRISALCPVFAHRPYSIVWFWYKVSEFLRAYYIHFHHNSP